jgi:phage-related protein
VKGLKKCPARFYSTHQGNEPVRDWLKELATADRKAVGVDIATAEYGWPVGMPVSRSMGNGLFEIRTNLSGKRISRVLFSITDDNMVLLHGFIKKTRRTPKHDMDLALKRLKRIKRLSKGN